MDNLRQIFGIDAKYETWDKKGRLPLYITERYPAITLSPYHIITLCSLLVQKELIHLICNG